MKKKLAILAFVVFFFFLVAPALVHASSQAQDNAIATRPDISLLQALSTYVDPYTIEINFRSLKKNFLPLLYLGKGGKALYGRFGMNTTGRFFSLVVEKKSKSGEIRGYFDITFYLEKYEKFYRGKNAGIVSSRVYMGKAIGCLPTDNILVSVYAIGKQDYLVNDDAGNTINSLSLPDEKLWSPMHTTSMLINSGKSIGDILSEHLEAIEAAGKGNKYSNDAFFFYKTDEKKAAKSGRYLVWF